MKTKKNERLTYDRSLVGQRLKSCRQRLSWSRGYVAEKTGIVEKYYADIERGTCGMSIETMLALAKVYDLSLDELIYGVPKMERQEEDFWIEQLQDLPPRTKACCARLVRLFLEGIRGSVETTS